MSFRGINRRRFLRAAAGTAGVLSSLHMSCGKPANRKKPNFIVIMADDCSAKEFGCYGNAVNRTPNIDRLAETGVQFRTCWSTPLCIPTRAQLMTGKYGFHTRWYHNSMTPMGEKDYSLGNAELTFGKCMRDNGYATAIAGKWQIGRRWDESGRDLVREAYGFDEYCIRELPRVLKEEHKHFEKVAGATGPYWNPGQRGPFWQPLVTVNGDLMPTEEDDFGPDIFTDFVNGFVKDHRDEPFFVYYPMSLIHDWWYPPVSEKIRHNITVPVPELDENGNKTGNRTKAYDTIQGGVRDNVEYLDHLIGKIVKNLDEQGVRDNTVIMFTCDNGTWGYGKGHLRGERAVLVPMVVNCPGLVKAAGPCDDPVQLADVFPTMMELAGIQPPQGAEPDGVSFAPALKGETGAGREWIFAYLADQRALRDRRWLLDGQNRFYDCGDNRSGEDYTDVTESLAPDVLNARKRFDEVLKSLPAPSPDDPLMERYHAGRKRLREMQLQMQKNKQ